MARAISGDESFILYEPDFKIYGRLLVEGAPLEDYVGGINPLLSAKITQDLDQPVQSATFVCKLLTGSQSLSPYWTPGATSFTDHGPLLMEDRAVAFQIQCRPASSGIDAGAWRKVFEGSIDTVEVSPTASTVTLSCRDSMVKLLLTEIENIYTNADSQPAWGFDVPEGLIQDGIQFILDTAWTYSYGSGFPDPLAVIGSQSTTASAFHQERMNLLQACRDLGVGKNGWDLRGKWDLADHGQDSFVLCYYEPGRDAFGYPIGANGFVHTVAEGGIVYKAIRSLSRSRIGVRNVAEVTPADSARVPVVAENAESIALYGRRFEAIAEDAASHIDTSGEATTLGEIIVTDLGKPKSAIELELPFVWFLEINDVFAVGSDGHAFDYGVGGPDFDNASTLWVATHIELMYALGKGSCVVQGRENGAAAQALHWRKKDEFVRENQRQVYVGIDQAPIGPARERAIWLPIAPP